MSATNPNGDDPAFLPALTDAGAARQARLDAVALRARIRAGIFTTSAHAISRTVRVIEIEPRRAQELRSAAEVAVDSALATRSLDDLEFAHELLNQVVREFISAEGDAEWIGPLRSRLMRLTPAASHAEPTRSAPDVSLVAP